MASKISTGEKIYAEAVKLEKLFWDREDYGEEHIPLLSNIMDYIDANKKDFIDYFNEKD